MTIARVLVATLLLSTTTSCLPKKDANSAVKFDDATRKSLDAVLTDDMWKKVCRTTPIFLFFANGERLVALEDRDDEFLGAADLSADIGNWEEAAGALRLALTRMPLGCERALRETNEKPHALLVTVLDGPAGGSDSSIRSTWFGYDGDRARSSSGPKGRNEIYSAGWIITKEEKWQVKGGKVVPAEDGASWEISLPDAVQPVSEFFLKQKPPGFKGDFRFDQTVYLFKTHGAEFHGDGPVDVAGHYRMLRNPARGKAQGTAFLFDPHGEDTNGGAKAQGAGLYFPQTYASYMCERFAGATTSKDPAPGKEMCEQCQAFLRSVKERGAFDQCDYARAAEAKEGGKKKSSTLGVNTDSTLGVNTDSTLGVNTDSTLGVNTDSTLGVNTDSTLGVNTDSTLGVNTDSTLGVGTGPSLEGSLGSGKSTVYSKKPVGDFVNGVLKLGRAIVYVGDKSIDGTVSVALPLRGKKANPPMVILDSCHGDPSIGTSLFKLENADVPIVTVSNPNAMGLTALRYDALDFGQYLALAHIQSEYFFNGWVRDEISAAKEAIDKHLTTEGVGQIHSDKAGGEDDPDKLDGKLPSRTTIDKDKASLKHLDIQVIHDGKILEKK